MSGFETPVSSYRVSVRQRVGSVLDLIIIASFHSGVQLCTGESLRVTCDGLSSCPVEWKYSLSFKAKETGCKYPAQLEKKTKIITAITHFLKVCIILSALSTLFGRYVRYIRLWYNNNRIAIAPNTSKRKARRRTKRIIKYKIIWIDVFWKESWNLRS